MKNVMRVLALMLLLMALSGQEGFVKTKFLQVGPGTYFSEYSHPHPWVLYVIESDLTNPYITLESVKANDYLYAFEGPSSMSARKNTAGHYVVSAINGDFYNTSNGEPISVHAVNGEFVKTGNNIRSGFAVNEFNKLNITNSQFTGSLFAKDTLGQWSSANINSVNGIRNENNLVIYNSFKGNSTGTNEHGYECLAAPIDDWVINDTVRCVVEAVESYVGNMTIPDGKCVISGHGTVIPFLSTNCQVGDTVKIVQGLLHNLPALKQVVGGGPRMLQNGIDVVAASYPSEGIGSSFCSDRHPRTAIGFNQDTTKVYFVVVDGRQEGFSAGMSLLVPDIEAGNVLYKAFVFFAKAKVAAVVLGARAPIVLTSRSDDENTKFSSIVLAAAMA